MYLNNFELSNSETLDYYGLLCEQREEHAEDQVGAKDTTAAAGKVHGDEDEEMRTDGDDFSVALCASRGFRAVRFRRTIVIIFIVTFGCSPRRVEQKRQQQRVRGDDETDGS